MIGGSARHLRMTAERFRRMATLSQSARDVVEVERVLLTRQFGLGDRFVRGFARAHAAFRAIALRQGRLTAAIRSGMSVLNAVGFLGLVLVGAALIGGGGLEAGVLLAALFIVGQMLTAVIQMGDLAGRAAEAATAGPAAVGVLERRARPRPRAADAGRVGAPSGSPRSRRRTSGSATTRRAACSRTSTCGSNAGGSRALTAETGAGKSTFARTLCGLLEPHAGRVDVMLDGAADGARERWSGEKRAPVRALPPGSILYLGARPILLAGSLRDNLVLPPRRGRAAARGARRRGRPRRRP